MQMNDVLVVTIDGQSMLEFDRSKPLPGLQRRFLDKMDHDMDQGVSLGGLTIDQPDLLQKAQFVAINLIGAIRDNEEQLAAAMCTYLANRVPDLKQVKAVEKVGETFIDLVFDQDYVKEVKVDFINLASNKKH
jgi:hypothetical protein